MLAPLTHHSFSLLTLSAPNTYVTSHPFTFVQTQQSPESLSSLEACCKMAATYSPAGVQYHSARSGLTFSVRNGKRWNPVAITTGNIS